MINIIANRNAMLDQPWRSALFDKTSQSVIICSGLSRLGLPAAWQSPDAAFGDRPLQPSGGWNVMTAQPEERNGKVERFLRINGQSNNVLIPGSAQLADLPRYVADRLVKMVQLSVDKLHATFGIYDPERALRKLSALNPGAAIVAINHQVAYAVIDGVVFSQIVKEVEKPGWAEGKDAAFFCGFFATWLRGGGIQRSLVAGHANGAAVASSFSAVDALLDKTQLDIAVERVLGQAAPRVLAPRPAAPLAAAAGWAVSSILGLFE